MPDKVGQQIGNYRLVQLLGSGGFADVYLGQHVHLASKQAAVKMLKLFDVDIQKFQEEAETTEKLVHPHIVRLLDFALQEGTPFLVLDFAPGGTLRTRHPRGSQLPIATVVGYLKEITPALQYAHGLSILHRDIKPENILIGRGGELLLSDFGIAVLSQTGRTSLQNYTVGGTPFYMAPEQYSGKPEKASDQYSLAVVVYEWLCGTVPFREGNFIQLGFQHTYVPVPPMRDKNPSILPEVEQVVLIALAKKPEERFGSVQAFATALEQACIPTIPAEKSVSGQAIPDKKIPPDQSSRQKSDKEQPPQRIQDEGVPSQLTPPSVAPVSTADQSPLQNIGAQVVLRNWWMVALRGVLAIIFGLFALFFPGITLLAFLFVFAAYAIIDGIVAVIVAIRERGSLSRWGWVLFEGILSILAGILVLFYPRISDPFYLLYIVAARAIVTGIMEIVAAFAIREFVSREWVLALAGILSVAFGILLFIYPSAGILSIVWLVGIYGIVFGVLFIIRAFQLRSWASSVTTQPS